jgi:hypothetical protein
MGIHRKIGEIFLSILAVAGLKSCRRRSEQRARWLKNVTEGLRSGFGGSGQGGERGGNEQGSAGANQCSSWIADGYNILIWLLIL